MIRVREGVNLLELLGELGFTTYRLRKDKIFSESSIQRLRKDGLPSWQELDYICKVTMYDISELIEFVDDRAL